MTVGEKIQFYRKQIGLSQDELGQKLLVSRQTVSLWEMNKTMPTVDNLLLLKEIFAVSVDDILSESNPVESKRELPKESYRFEYSAAELNDIFKKVRTPLFRNAIIFALSLLFLVISSIGEETPMVMVGMLLGIFFTGMFSHIKGYLVYKKAWKGNQIKMLENTYSYQLFDTYFILNISKSEEIIKTFKIFATDIEKVQDLGTYLILQNGGQAYIIKKGSLINDSLFYSYCKNNKKIIVETRVPRDILKILSIILFVCSIATVLGALMCVSLLSEINHLFVKNMWIFFLFIPVPIASILFAFYLKRKGYRYKKNIVVGIVMTVILCIYASFSFLFTDIYTHNEEPILKVEQLLEIDIPTYSRIQTQDWTRGTQSLPRGYIYFTSDIYFDENSVKDFEKHLSDDIKWMSSIPTDMIGITSYFCDIQAFDYCIIYNTQTKEFNKLPTKSGSYRLINVLYNCESNTMQLVEYEIEYTK